MAILSWLEIIERTITNGVKAWLGIKRNAEKIAKLQSEVERLQTQVDDLQARWLYIDARLDNEEKTTSMILSDRETLEAKINRAMTNSEHAIQIANNATRNT